MASESKSPTAGPLLQGLAFMFYCYHAGCLTTVHVPGVENVMADIASRPSKLQTLFCASSPLSNTNFLSSFDTAFPLPNAQAWTLTMVPQWLKSNVFKTLRGKRLELRRGRVQARTPLESVEDALPPLSPNCQQVGKCWHGLTPHVCCCHAGRTVQSWSSGQDSVSQKGSQARCPKACFGRTSQPLLCLPGLAIT
jgi:hypothetical protein